jgi:hypothetical protein
VGYQNTVALGGASHFFDDFDIGWLRLKWWDYAGTALLERRLARAGSRFGEAIIFGSATWARRRSAKARSDDSIPVPDIKNDYDW